MTENTPATGRHQAVRTFIKAQLSAQLASLADFALTLLLFRLCHVFYLYATFMGSVAGGIVNCVANYKWVFHSEGCRKLHVALKYMAVWAGSILLNTGGTYVLTGWLTALPWTSLLPEAYAAQAFMAAKIIVAVLVAVCWNYHMQRIFVYRSPIRRKPWKSNPENPPAGQPAPEEQAAN